ncbi:hypothetical protein PIB30_046449 [Stylosanthes scabra]|uniref:Uncharacterized protein n=1 Tax=Stylosanthes scabra TaxID=79078 RepID=A0ABU6ZF85_9FABA|nr:hypothetical protein [Stylosanthes scabra]
MKASKKTKLPWASIGHVTWPKRDIHEGSPSSAKLTSSHVWPTSKTWPKRDPPGPHLTRSHVWPTSKTWPKRDQPIPLPKLTQTNLEQARSRLNILKISSQAHTPSSQVWSTFLGSKNVTSSLATPRSRLSHVGMTLQTPKQASQALPSFKQGHVWTKSQTGTWPKRDSPPQGPRLAAMFPTFSNCNSA